MRRIKILHVDSVTDSTVDYSKNQNENMLNINKILKLLEDNEEIEIKTKNGTIIKIRKRKKEKSKKRKLDSVET